MGLRCSLLGHDFGEPDEEEEREARGDEEIITIREIERCARCDEVRVISEHTEVRAIEPHRSAPDPTESRATDTMAERFEVIEETDGVDGRTAEADREHAGRDDTRPPENDEGGAVFLDDDGTEREPEEWFDGRDPGPEASSSEQWMHESDVTADDEETEEDGDGGWVGASPTERYGSDSAEPSPWPDEPDDAPTDDAEIVDWPEHQGDDEGFDAEPDSGPAEDVEFEGMTPRRADGRDESGWTAPDSTSDGPGWTADPEERRQEPADSSTDGSSLGFTPAESGADRADVDGDVPTEFYCPECGLNHVAEESSLRPGDICPECRTGYIGERAR